MSGIRIPTSRCSRGRDRVLWGYSYPISDAFFRIFIRSSSLMPVLPAMALDTVTALVPTARAISRIVGFFADILSARSFLLIDSLTVGQTFPGSSACISLRHIRPLW